MKKTLFVIVPLFLFSILSSGQINADAGDDIVICVTWDHMDSLTICGDPAATGGTPPYSYAWEAEYTFSIGENTYTFTASNFLNDTTLANPTVKTAIGDKIDFLLTVTDIDNNTAFDSVTVYFSHFGTHLGMLEFNIDLGDSIFLYGMENVFGGLPPYSYLWRPNHGLTDSTSLAFWAKPEYSIAYYLTKTDSAGCVVTGTPVYLVNVLPVHTDEIDFIPRELSIYPNPVHKSLKVIISEKITGPFVLSIYAPDGKKLMQEISGRNAIKLDTDSFPPGIYIVKVENDSGFRKTEKIIIN